MLRTLITLVNVAILLSIAAPAARAAEGGKIVYNRDIRPLLSDNCFHCHGNDKNHVKGKLRLNDRDAAIARKAIVPGKPDESELIARIVTDDVDEIMPPPESHKKLTAAQKDLIRRWVAEGAEYQPHWAYITPTRPEVPAVKDAAGARNAIDRFVQAELERRGIKPSGEADRRTLIRRLSLDLIGLPPTPAEVDAFVNDKSADAYEKLVDRLLASPHFGERMAVPWLDAVRFSDTVGYHGDQNQNVFPYRDYVINAFNANKPFDVFTAEQIAGDLLPKPTTEQLVASGFNRLNMMTREGGAQAKEYLAKYQADRVRTVSMAWMGSTFGCAECHDHKFDPISAHDFYAMSAFFADIRQWGIYTTYNYTPNPDLPGWTNDHPFPPEIKVDSPYLIARKAKLQKRATALATTAAAKLAGDPKAAAAFEQWTARVAGLLRDGSADGFYEVETVVTGKTKLGPDADRDPSFTTFVGAPAGKTGATVEMLLNTRADTVAALRLEVAGDLAAKKLTKASGPIKLAVAVRPAKGSNRPVGVYYAEADKKEPRYSSTAEVLGIRDGWSLSTKALSGRQTGYWLLDAPVRLAPGEGLAVTISGETSLPMRLSVSMLASPEALPLLDADTRAAFLAAPAARTDDQRALLARAYLAGTGYDAEAFAGYKELHKQIAECRDGKAFTQVTVSQKPFVTRVLPRGNWQDDSGEVVKAETPHFLPKLPGAGDKPLSRLDLAKWLTSPENPLTSRVVVNRFWKQFFGTGLCASVEDLGLQGEWPSHPELLDWLAVEFHTPTNAGDKAWDVKRVVRLMVTSATYRQASNLPVALRETDPANRLLSAQSPRRLEAEFVRDNALAAAGLLNLVDIGGPSVKPYQPDGYYGPIQFPNRPYNAERDERQYRRGVYVHWQRTFLHPMLANFDAPSREDAICARVQSNTPQQALTMLNDPTFVEASRVLAENVMTTEGTDEQKLDVLFQRVLSRQPKAAERASLLKFLANQRAAYKAAPDEAKALLAVGNRPATGGVDPAELAAWANASRVVLNLHEAITRY